VNTLFPRPSLTPTCGYHLSPLQWLLVPRQAHLVGLRIVGFLCTSLDAVLLLQTRHDLVGTLLRLQEEAFCICREGDDEAQPCAYILDAATLARNRLLVRSGPEI